MMPYICEKFHNDILVFDLQSWHKYMNEIIPGLTTNGTAIFLNILSRLDFSAILQHYGH